MNESPFNRSMKEAFQASMTNEEKQIMLERLSSYVEKTSKENSRLSPFKIFMRLNYSYAILSALIFIVGSGSLGFAAENALPGDTLYPVKINLNEKVREVATLGTSAKAAWEAEKMKRRLAEAEILASKGGLNENLQKEVEIKLSNHIKTFDSLRKEVIDNGENEEATELSLEYEATLNAHREIFEKMKDRATTFSQKEKLVNFETKLLGIISVPASTTKDNNSEELLSEEKREDENNSKLYEKKQEEIKQLIDSSEKILEKKSKNRATNTLEADILDESKERVKNARKILRESEESHSAGKISDAESLLQTSKRTAREAQILLQQQEIIEKSEVEEK